MQLLEDPFCSKRIPAPEQHRRPIAAQLAEKEAEDRASRSLAAHDSGSSEGDGEVQRCQVSNCPHPHGRCHGLKTRDHCVFGGAPLAAQFARRRSSLLPCAPSCVQFQLF